MSGNAEMSYRGKLWPINSTGMRAVVDEASALRSALAAAVEWANTWSMTNDDLAYCLDRPCDFCKDGRPCWYHAAKELLR